MRSTASRVRSSSVRRLKLAAGTSEPSHQVEQLEQRQYFIADPVTTTHPMWFATYGAATVNGTIDANEWANTTPIVRAAPNRVNSAATIRMMYNENGLFLSADVRDEFLWSDGSGGGTGTRYDWYDDDALALFFDPSNTRRRYLPTMGRMLAFNLGQPAGKVEGAGRVTRFNYISGNNDLMGFHVNPFGALSPGMRWQTRLWGTLNNNADIDRGWTTEVFLPWASIGMTGMPSNGSGITMNFTVKYDDDGGVRNQSTFEHSTNPAERFGPRTIDDQIDGVPSSFNVSQPGLEGPVSYAQLVFVDPRNAGDVPTSVRNLTTTATTGFGTTLVFNAPTASLSAMSIGGARRGGVAGYDVRWSESPIVSEDDWSNATSVQNAFVAKMQGRLERLRIGGLEPGVTYYVGVRGVDAVGRVGALVTTTLTTLDYAQDPSMGSRVIPAPGGGGLQTESGSPFVIVGSHAIQSNFYVRNLFKGDVWNAANDTYVNFYQNPGGEGDPDGFFQSLASYGVNTLRVPLEWLAIEEAGQGQLPRGTQWLEYPAGNFNPDMRDYLHAMMGYAAEYGIKLILHPFSTFNYRTFFNTTAYAAQNGGPLTSIDDFFQNPTVLTMATNRVRTIMDWVNASPNAEAVLGIELVNEWDDWTWTLNVRGEGDPARIQEMRDRSKFMTRLAMSAKAYDAKINILSSSIGLIPRGPTARALFIADGFDMLAPHYYSASTAEPVNNPDANKSIRPVTDYAALASYWSTQRRDNRPINNGEWALVKWAWDGGRTYYTGVSPVSNPSKPWTVQNDTDLFRTTAWTQVAMGLGSGLRLGGQEMRDLVPAGLDEAVHGYLPLPLPTSMREIQRSISTFATDNRLGFDFNQHDATPLSGRIRFSGTDKRLIGVGSATRTQGMVYVIQDLNRTSGTVSNSTMTIDGLTEGMGVEVEFWSTGNNADVLGTNAIATVVGGRLSFVLPNFGVDVMVRWRGT